MRHRSSPPTQFSPRLASACWRWLFLLALVSSLNAIAQWPLAQSFVAPNFFDAQFGNAVSIHGDYMVVGSQSTDHSGGVDNDLRGAAYVYQRSTCISGWDPIAELRPADITDGANFGRSVSVHGNTIAIGAPFHNVKGSVFIYTISGSDVVFDAELISPFSQNLEGFGTAVSLEGPDLVVGASMENIPSGTGAAYYFHNTGGAWSTGVALVPAITLAAGDHYGAAVSVQGDVLAVGAPRRTTTQVEDGLVALFKRIAPTTWNTAGALLPDGLSSYLGSPEVQHFGTAVSVSDRRVLVGAPAFSEGFLHYRGLGYLFFESTTGSWSFDEVRSLKGPEESDVFFGGSLALHEELAAIGSYKNLGSEVRVFDRNLGGVDQWEVLHNYPQPDPSAAAFGAAVSLWQGSLLVGARDAGGLGAAYLYQQPGVSDNVYVDIQGGAEASEINWVIRDGCGTIVCSGAGIPLDGCAVLQPCGLPDGCYTFEITDTGGDGFTGGYALRNASGARIMDNEDGFTGATAAHGANGGFCLPMGTTNMILERADNLWLPSNGTLIATAVPAVTALYVPGDPINAQPGNAGYEFWIFDPDGGYHQFFSRFHNSPGCWSNDNTRAQRLCLNQLVPSVPANKVMNVRIRPIIPGVATDFGPASRFMVGPANTCFASQLVDLPTHPRHSWGVVRDFGAADDVFALRHATYEQYQFNWIGPDGQNFVIPRTSTTVAETNRRFILAFTNDGGHWPTTSLPAPEAGEEWCVRVRARYRVSASPLTWSAWCDWGYTAPVTIGNVQMPLQPVVATDYAPRREHMQVWPNPNQGESIFVHASDLDLAAIAGDVVVHDASGRLVWSTRVPVTDGMVNTMLDLPKDLRSGLYHLQLTVGATTFAEKVLIDR